MQTGQISMKVSATGADLLTTIKFDGIEIYHQTPSSDAQLITHEFDDESDSPHLVEIVLSGKLPEHTMVDANGVILEDRVITIHDMALDDIPLGHLLTTVAEYHHNNNGQGPEIVDSFYGDMGCNGTVKFSFTSPLYLWLLESM